ncbi:MAG: type II secretion system GspH family protein [Candidatus Omnitrophica bacterium]|nr:type II secretion system GspH family protein [Candidatus Omnitrophota bacterium]MBU4479480.1 type II secretion system GspH family protein [Candidatus Omnitrophota bacterium]
MTLPEKCRGFILLETLVALVVMSVGISFLIQALSLIVRINRRVRDNQTALLLADNIFNRFYALENDVSRKDDLEIEGKSFSRQIDSSDLTGHLKEITCRIIWKGSGKNNTVSLSHVLVVP